MPKIDQKRAPTFTGTSYPPPYDEPCRTRVSTRLAQVAGLTQFGVNINRLPPGCWSSHRHFHTHEDEFVYVLEGEVVLVTDAGEERLGPGDCAGFPGGSRDGHHLQNRSAADAVVLVVGSRIDDDHGEYSDIDLKFHPGRYSGKSRFTKKNGEAP